jgi:hypothetical protein
MAGLALISIASGCVNRGNLIIECMTRRVLSLDDSTLMVDAYQPLGTRELDEVNACDVLVLPGATLLQPGDHAAMEQLERVRCPIFALGSALRSPLDLPDVSVARALGTTIGSRDPFTHKALQSRGIGTVLVGCQTLFLARACQWKNRSGPIVFCPGLGDQSLQDACMFACAELAPTIVLCHAPAVQYAAVSDHPGLSQVALDDAEHAFALFGSASVVVTGRLHALLCCVALGTPVIFIGGWYDSRYSMLDLLGVSVEPPVAKRVQRLVEKVAGGDRLSTYCLEAADGLRRSMQTFIRDVGEPLGLTSHVFPE